MENVKRHKFGRVEDALHAISRLADDGIKARLVFAGFSGSEIVNGKKINFSRMYYVKSGKRYVDEDGELS